MNAAFATISVSRDHRGVVRLALNRPDARNALSQTMIRELRQAAAELRDSRDARVVVLAGAGEVFCAGGDLKEMRDQVGRDRAERMADATELAELLAELDTLPQLVIGRINGAAFGGGVGLISVCDIAIGVAAAKFRLTEVRLGLVPATISPYVVARLGVAGARRVMLNALEIDGAEAVRLGLLSRAVDAADLDAAVDAEVSAALSCAPAAIARCKELIRFVSRHETADNILYTAACLADAWESPEVREGIAAFLEKRRPHWDASG